MAVVLGAHLLVMLSTLRDSRHERRGTGHAFSEISSSRGLAAYNVQ